MRQNRKSHIAGLLQGNQDKHEQRNDTELVIRVRSTQKMITRTEMKQKKEEEEEKKKPAAIFLRVRVSPAIPPAETGEKPISRSTAPTGWKAVGLPSYGSTLGVMEKYGDQILP